MIYKSKGGDFQQNERMRACEFCGEEFLVSHDLQRYCPEKYGRKNYCNYEQKKLVNESRLADMVQDVAAAVEHINDKQQSVVRNIGILRAVTGDNDSIEVTAEQLDAFGYDIYSYTRRVCTEECNSYAIEVGPYRLYWTGYESGQLKFKITKI